MSSPDNLVFPDIIICDDAIRASIQRNVLRGGCHVYDEYMKTLREKVECTVQSFCRSKEGKQLEIMKEFEELESMLSDDLGRKIDRDVEARVKSLLSAYSAVNTTDEKREVVRQSKVVPVATMSDVDFYAGLKIQQYLVAHYSQRIMNNNTSTSTNGPVDQPELLKPEGVGNGELTTTIACLFIGVLMASFTLCSVV
ncbi:hypothetical protein TRVA0_053S01134 [Trichomonascus vanleenenianus]|uniref:uncharacterized protein n=1 Tax=Trichomonascus vanleenenianus TaxID=2268995 RepID=UPI003EC9CFB8